MSTSDPPVESTKTSIHLRNPTTFTPSTPGSIHTEKFVPSTQWLLGTWHVTHSTLPMWRKARNISITYTPIGDLPSASDPRETQDYITAQAVRLNDQVKYQSVNQNSDKIKTISGISSQVGPGAFNWRGSGWLKIASSHWEILGHGEDGDIVEGREAAERDQWVVTFFAKTLFTPAGIDIYSRRREGLNEQKIRDIGEALSRVQDPAVKGLVSELFEVKRDH